MCGWVKEAIPLSPIHSELTLAMTDIVIPTVTIQPAGNGKQFLIVDAPHWKVRYWRTNKPSPASEGLTIEQRRDNLQAIITRDVEAINKGESARNFVLRRFIAQGYLKAQAKLHEQDQGI